MTSYSFRPARRSEAKPLIGLYAESGCGKTYSALLLARGFVGPNGRIGMIETESGRGEAYADLIPGGYDVLPIRESFAPKNFGDAITAAEQAKLDALIIDSASHEWQGAGGVLAMAAAAQEAGTKAILAWKRPKMDHQSHFMLRILQTPIPLVILCMRAKYPMLEGVNPENNKKEWYRSKELEPTQADDILFEMFVHGWIDHQHNLHVTKYSRDDLRAVIQDNKPITLETGRALAAWAGGSSRPAPSTTDAANQGSAGQPSLPGAAAEPEDFKRLDHMLAEAADRGSAVLATAWKNLTPKEQHMMDAALRRRHKPRAIEVDKELAEAES